MAGFFKRLFFGEEQDTFLKLANERTGQRSETLSKDSSCNWSHKTAESIEETMPNIKIISVLADCVHLNIEQVKSGLEAPVAEECSAALLAFELGAINHAIRPFYNLSTLNKENRFKILASVILYCDIKDGRISKESEWQTKVASYLNALTKKYSTFIQLGYNFDEELSNSNKDDNHTIRLFEQMLKQINEKTHFIEETGTLVARNKANFR